MYDLIAKEANLALDYPSKGFPIAAEDVTCVLNGRICTCFLDEYEVKVIQIIALAFEK